MKSIELKFGAWFFDQPKHATPCKSEKSIWLMDVYEPIVWKHENI
jgi:hypothetical protein